MKKLIGTTTGIASLLVLAQPASAAINICPNTAAGGQNFAALCTINFDNLGSVVNNILIIVLTVAVVISLFFLIWGGIKWITSGGDKAGVEAARNHVVAAIVGLVIALLAFFIIQIVGGLFGIGISNLTPPKITQ